MVKSHKFDFDDFIRNMDDKEFVHIIYSSEKVVFAIPFGLPLTSFEKVLSPFDQMTWLLILITLSTTFIGIKVVSFCSMRLRDMCFGERIGSPTMSFLNVFLCGGQTNVPGTSNARFIFFNFLVWSLLIRTCFQSLMYRALQMDLRHPPMKTFQDVHVNSFKQYAEFPNDEKLNDDPELQNFYGYPFKIISIE